VLLCACIKGEEKVKIENCKKGVRVEMKKGDYYVPKGATGTIIEDSCAPYVKWDEPLEQPLNALGCDNVRPVCNYEIRKIKK
jgi:hypothetical protein